MYIPSSCLNIVHFPIEFDYKFLKQFDKQKWHLIKSHVLIACLLLTWLNSLNNF